jgi:PDZ domain-containing protein
MRKLGAFLPFAALLIVLASVEVPLYALGPGPARDVVPRIMVSGLDTYPSDDQLLLTSVLFNRVTPLRAIAGWIDPAVDVVPEREVLPPGESPELSSRRSVSQMDSSKVAAATVVLSALGDVSGYPGRHDPGALVSDVVEGCPGEGHLFPGDIITEVNGTAITSADQFSDVMDGLGTNEVEMVVDADGETEDVQVTRHRCAGSERPLVGIGVVEPFPYDISFESGDIGGPSAGLMWALGLYDLLTEGELTGGRVVAGTGTIDTTGAVGPIGGIEQKVEAAERAGAEVFLVPRENFHAARSVADELELVPVGSFEEALAYLEGPPPTTDA